MFAEDERILCKCITNVKYLAGRKKSHQTLENLKNNIIESNLVAIFDESLVRTIACDVSDKCLAGTPRQESNSKTGTICNASRILSEVKPKDLNTERELLAVVSEITKKCRCFVKNRRVKVLTDHKPLVGSSKLTEEKRRTVILRMKLEEFNFELIH
jgi:RNase H-like domain found in reverse transcriptase